MLISTQHQFVFLCTPKCASNSIEDMLQPFSDIALLGKPAVRHTNYKKYRHHIKPYLQSVAGVEALETVCLVREPLSWLNSWYRFRARPQLADPQHPNHKQSTYGLQFAEFLEAYMLPEPPLFANVGSQHDFVADEAGNIAVDKIFAYEHIDDFVAHMSDKIGQRLALKTMNVSPSSVPQSARFSTLRKLQQRARRKLHLQKPRKSAPKRYMDELPEPLLDSLKDYIKKDFSLHQNLLKAPA